MSTFVSSAGGPIVRKGIEFKLPTRHEIARHVAQWAADDTAVLVRGLVGAGVDIGVIRNESWEHQRILSNFSLAVVTLTRFDRALEVCQAAAPGKDLEAFSEVELAELAAELWGQEPTKEQGGSAPLDGQQSPTSQPENLTGAGSTA
jgi:hypothetical protein